MALSGALSEGLLAWGLKNKNGAGGNLMAEWAAKDPQRLLEWFRRNRDDQKELSLLGTIAGHSPELALQRLREMVEAGISENALRGGRGLMKELAGKSPALLEGMLDSLPFDLKIQAESALSQKRLEASFGDEIRALWEHPDGWKIFSAMDSAEVKDKLMGELGNLPDEWRRLMVSNYYQFIRRDNLRGWLDADLETAGFSSTESKVLKGHALQNLSSSDPAAAFKQLGETEVEPRMRGEILKQIFRSSLVNLEEMAQQLPEEDREIAASAMQSRRGGDSSVEVDAKTTPQELLDKMVALDPSSVGRRSSFPLLSGWDGQKVDALTEGFSSLPDDQKNRAASFITANAEFSSAPPELRGAALAYLAGMPDTSRRDDKASSRDSYEISFNSITAKVSNYAADMARKDPAKSASWVDSLPAGEAKPWAQYNVHKLWVQYDPDAAGAWKKTLTASEREAMEKVNQRE
ncbi:MAG: hypothetical protein EOP85_08085 [Verrucomicrobiaceae bacterium]|nr:MAG: hypothetical protein EOP85_08085 [Verrucomicrobiaceae bacterium]